MGLLSSFLARSLDEKDKGEGSGDHKFSFGYVSMGVLETILWENTWKQVNESNLGNIQWPITSLLMDMYTATYEELPDKKN